MHEGGGRGEERKEVAKGNKVNETTRAHPDSFTNRVQVNGDVH